MVQTNYQQRRLLAAHRQAESRRNIAVVIAAAVNPHRLSCPD
jgi:hypothetical protein